MTILVLNKRPLKSTPYYQWLENSSDSVVLFSSKENQSESDMAFAKQNYSEVNFLDDYDSGVVEAEVLKLNSRRPIGRIVALSEVDLCRAAQLREILGVQGMGAEQALAFRDKYIMKSILNDAGISTAPMKRIKSACDLLEFANVNEFPFVVKPTSLAGSMGVSVVRDENDLSQVLKTEPFSSYSVDAGMIVEKFVTGAIYHIDGIALGKKVQFSWPSHYSNGIFDFLKGQKACCSVMLDESNALCQRLRDFAANCVFEMPFPNELTAFHAEAFVGPTGEITLCEIAARPGGGGITEQLKFAFGIDLNEIATRGQAGQDTGNQLQQTPNKLTALLLFPKRLGTLDKIPESSPFEYIESFVVHSRAGSVFSGASRHSIDRIASAIISAPTEELLRQRTIGMSDWFNSEVKWS